MKTLQEIKRANIEGYHQEAAEKYDNAMGFKRLDINIERLRTKSLLKKSGIKDELTFTVLEIGVGTGISREILSGIFPQAVFFPSDISMHMLIKYNDKFPQSRRIICDAECLPIKNGLFDIVVCSSFVHHLPNNIKVLAETSRVLKEQGFLLGIREPRMHGCDFWFKFHYLAKRYGDRAGAVTLFKRLFGMNGGWKKIWSYEMSHKDFLALDTMEVRGAVLHPTPTKKHGGVDAIQFKLDARTIFNSINIYPFGFLASFLAFYSILFQTAVPGKLSLIAYKFDNLAAKVAPLLPYDSFSFICRKK